MKYQVQFQSKAIKALEKLPTQEKVKIVTKIEAMKNNLQGDVKKLTNFTPEYRLRVGKYRVLFEIEGEVLTIYQVKHRRDAYN
ncbi:MAG: type II toxin-antitoxin system RelE/ParE family toxin [Snowella sp.]|nr:type II toxin-antitoxin system RelE/ParE family toxin [Snowella sp.]